jgi:nucleotide-binding universal stress UspA family protein
MFRKILLPTHGKELEDHVLKYVAHVFPFSKFYIISIVETKIKGTHLTRILRKKLEEHAKEALQHAAELLEKEGINVEKKEVLYGHPSDKIVSYARENEITLIAFRCSPRELPSLSMGRTIEEVLKKTKIPVLLMREDIEDKKIKKILLPTDGSHGSQNAENVAIQLAVSFGAEIIALYVSKNNAEMAEKILKNIEWKCKQRNIKVETIHKRGEPPEEILNEAKGCDIIVMGAGRKGFFSNIVIGHVSRNVAAMSSIPIILVRGRLAL